MKLQTLNIEQPFQISQRQGPDGAPQNYKGRDPKRTVVGLHHAPAASGLLSYHRGCKYVQL